MKKSFLVSIQKKYRSFSPKTKTLFKFCAVLGILACGPSPIDYAEYFSLFYPENANTPIDTKPYYYSTMVLNEDPYYYEENPVESIEQKENIAAWEKYFAGKIDRNFIKECLYGDKKINVLASKVGAFDMAAKEYLIFTQNVENSTPHRENYWDYAPVIDSLKIESLIEKGKNGIENAPNDFLKERYLFQNLKLQAEIGKYKEVIEDYGRLTPKIKSKTLINDWSKSRVAGAIMANGDTAKSVFMFSEIFNSSESRRRQADLSVRRINPTFFKDALKLAITNDEKANVLALKGVQPFQDGLKIVKEIYELNPKHPLLELVFAREINKNEMSFFAEKNASVYGNSFYYYDENYKVDTKKVNESKKQGETYLSKLADFAAKVASENKVSNPQFWNLSSAYFFYLKNQSEKGLEILKSIKPQANIFQQKQIDFLTFEMMEKPVSLETEAGLLKIIEGFTDVKTFRDNNLLIKTTQTLSNYYAQNKEPKKSGWFWSCSNDKKVESGNAVKSFLAYNISAYSDYGNGYELSTNQNALVDTCSVDFLKKVIAFVDSHDLNINDKKLVQLSNLKADYLNLALARRQVLDSKFAEAAATLNLVSAKTLEENGFMENFESEPRDFYFGKKTATVKPSNFVLHLANLEAKTKEKSALADDWYQFGKALYNLSYYGKAWILTHRDKSSMELEYDTDIKNDYYLTENAKKAFEKALSLNPDKELAAKICYGGALCERNQYLVKFYSERPDEYDAQDAYNVKMKKEELPKFRTFFAKLLKDYKDTQYQKMILKECETYAAFNQ